MRNRSCAKFQPRADRVGRSVGSGVQEVRCKAGLAKDAVMGETERG
jgi:hypothetical protein